VENESMETLRVEKECRVQKKIREDHWTLDSAVNFLPGEEVLHLGSGVAHRRGTCIMRSSGLEAIDRAPV